MGQFAVLKVAVNAAHTRSAPVAASWTDPPLTVRPPSAGVLSVRREPSTNATRYPTRGKVNPVTSNVVNLSRFRKQKQREEKARQAEINRVKHGRTKDQKERERADCERAARTLDGKRLEQRSEGVARQADASEESTEQ